MKKRVVVSALLIAALAAGGLLYFTQVSVGGSYWADLFPGFLVLGVAIPFAFVPITIAALAGTKPQEAGLASGLINTSQQIGGAALGATGLSPSNLQPPAISGGAVSGAVLTASTGTWSGTPASYSYQWKLCASGSACNVIAGATGSSYAVSSADVGHTITVVVTATNLTGSTAAESSATAPISGSTGCVADPSGCGYPDATNSGVPAGSSLSARSEEMHVSAAGSTVKDVALKVSAFEAGQAEQDRELMLHNFRLNSLEDRIGHRTGQATGKVGEDVTGKPGVFLPGPATR